MSAEQKKYDVFISYSHADKSIAEAIFAFLTDKKIRCFIDSRDLQKGKNWAKTGHDCYHRPYATAD
jgi:hypothetical protein